MDGLTGTALTTVLSMRNGALDCTSRVEGKPLFLEPKTFDFEKSLWKVRLAVFDVQEEVYQYVLHPGFCDLTLMSIARSCRINGA